MRRVEGERRFVRLNLGARKGLVACHAAHTRRSSIRHALIFLLTSTRRALQDWSEDRNLLNYTSEENLVFCPGGDPRTPWNTGMPSDDQPVTNIGLAYQAALYTGTAATLGFSTSDYVITRPARDWVMGYEDSTLVTAQPSQPTIVRSSTVTPLQHNLSAPTQTDWARPSNGTMQVWTGASSSLGFAGL